MALKPWYKVVTPREDLREGRPLDASEFAVHLDQVRDGRAHADYQKPDLFFERTFLLVINHLRQIDEIVKDPSPRSLFNQANGRLFTPRGSINSAGTFNLAM